MKKLALVTSLLISFNASAALYDRGNGMIYDSNQNITWLQDANYAKTSGYDADGQMTWDQAQTWANNLVYGGFSDWRLPSARLVNPYSPCTADNGSCDSGWNNTTSELGHLFYVDLANKGFYNTSGHSQPGYGLLNAGFIDAKTGHQSSFLNTQYVGYWESEIYAPSISQQSQDAWAFFTNYGNQEPNYVNSPLYAWAVRDGDVASVPAPAAAWLFGSGLIGLAGAARRKIK